jgi:hypothetical protein
VKNKNEITKAELIIDTAIKGLEEKLERRMLYVVVMIQDRPPKDEIEEVFSFVLSNMTEKARIVNVLMFGADSLTSPDGIADALIIQEQGQGKPS